MIDNNRSPEDDDLDDKALVRAMRPRWMTMVAVLVALTMTIAGVAMLIASRADSVHNPAPKAAERSDASASCTPRDRSLVAVSRIDKTVKRDAAVYAVARQAVAIRTSPIGEDDALGTGFLIADGLVVSAAHIFGSLPGTEALPVHVLCNDAERDGTVLAFDPARDVVIIAAPACRAHALAFGSGTLPANEGLHVSGYSFDVDERFAYWFHHGTSPILDAAPPDGYRSESDEALVKLMKNMRDAHVRPFIVLSGAFVPGNSGSPIFDDGGKIVGMLVAVDWRLNRTYAVPTATILDVLTTNGISVLE